MPRCLSSSAIGKLGGCQRPDPILQGVDEVGTAGLGAHGLVYDGCHGCKRILDAMLQLVHEAPQFLLEPAQLGHVLEDDAHGGNPPIFFVGIEIQ